MGFEVEPDAVSAAIVYSVTAGPSPDWEPGPLPVELPAWAREEGWLDRPTADLAARSSYFDQGLLPALYGSPGNPARWCRPVDEAIGEAHLWGLELVRAPRATHRDGGLGLLVVHCSVGAADAIATLEGLTRIPPTGTEPAVRTHLASHLPSGWRLPDRRMRAQTIVFAHRSTNVAGGEPVAGFDTDEVMLWLLASTTRLTSYPPARAELHGNARVSLSADWSALVLRDGIGLLGLSDSERFGRLATALAHSLYLDVLLLGLMQLHGVEDMAATLADRGLDRGQTRDLIRLERQLFDFRRQIWWTRSGRRHADALLGAFHEQHSLPARVGSLTSDIGDGARLAQSVIASRIAAALGIVSLVGVPFSVVYAGAALLPSGWLNLVIATACGLVVAVALAVLTPLRDMVFRGGADE